MFLHIKSLLFLFLFLFTGASAAQAGLHISEVAYKRQGTSDYLVVYIDAPASEKKLFALENPPRLVLDISRANNKRVTLPKLPEDAAVKGLRFGQFSPVTSRFVMELKDEIRDKQLHVFKAGKGQPHRIVVEMKRGKGFKASTALSKEQVKQAIPVPEAKPFFSKSNRHKPLIVIDAGHGGKDPGAVGQHKTLEKKITLSYALALQKTLLRTGDYNVAMTRNSDDYIYLDERVKMAREASGDVFISLHADTAPEDYARGLSVYTVSEKASDASAALLAKAENEADKIGGIKFAEDNPDVADILIDLASRDTRIKSNDLAAAIVKRAGKQKIHLLKNPNRFAGFRVLKAPDIPSVLVEIGFLSNKEDEALLQNIDHRNKVITAITHAVDDYFAQHPKR